MLAGATTQALALIEDPLDGDRREIDLRGIEVADRTLVIQLTTCFVVGIAIERHRTKTQLGCDQDDFIDCTNICEAKRDCLDPGYDVETCVDVCKETAERGDADEHRIEACGECANDRGCTDVTACFEECPEFP